MLRQILNGHKCKGEDEKGRAPTQKVQTNYGPPFAFVVLIHTSFHFIIHIYIYICNKNKMHAFQFSLFNVLSKRLSKAKERWVMHISLYSYCHIWFTLNLAGGNQIEYSCSWHFHGSNWILKSDSIFLYYLNSFVVLVFSCKRLIENFKACQILKLIYISKINYFLNCIFNYLLREFILYI